MNKAFMIITNDDISGEIFKRIIIDNNKTNYYVSMSGIVIYLKDNKYHKLTQSIDKQGYHRVYMYRSNHKIYNKLVHRLVASAFISNNDNKEQVNHIDGDKSNNDISNLEWCTNQENRDHAVNNNLYYHKYSLDQIHHVCKLLEENKLTPKEISNITDIPYNYIFDILYKKKLTRISKNYNIDNYDRHLLTKYSLDQIHHVCKLLEENKLNMKMIEYLTDVNYFTITDIKYHKIYTDISKNYNIDNYTINSSIKYPKELKNNIMCLLQEGKSSKEIRDILNLDNNDSVKQLLYSIRKKLKNGKKA